MYANFGIISRELLNEIGGFDEDFPLYGTDNALAFRVLIAGKGIAAIPGKQVLHNQFDDEERRANNDMPARIRTVEILVEKYKPHFKQMRDTYIQNGGIIQEKDQTPPWVRRLMALQ